MPNKEEEVGVETYTVEGTLMVGQDREDDGDDDAVPADEGVCVDPPEAVLERVCDGIAVDERVDEVVCVIVRLCEKGGETEGVADDEGDSDGVGLVVAYSVAVSERVSVGVSVGLSDEVKLLVDVAAADSDPDEVESGVSELETVSALDTELDGDPV